MLTLRQRLNRLDKPTDQTFSLDFFRGLPFEVKSAVFQGNGLFDVESLSSVSLLIKAEPTSETSLLAATVAAIDFDEDCTLEAWAASTGEQMTFSFSAAETNIDLGTDPKKKLWAVFKGLLTNGFSLVLARGWITAHESGIDVTGDPPENPAPALGVAEADARFVRFDGEQSLTEEQQEAALTNLGLGFLAGATKANGRITLNDGSSIFLEAAP
ncbi:MAG: hypothetical protein V4662_17645 [Verrucomicrobiota bacterium]